MNRILKGLEIYKKGELTLKHKDDTLIIFNTPGSKGETYQVSIYDNYVICDCDDYKNRYKKEYGSYICKHLWAAFFEVISMYKIADLKDFDLKKYLSVHESADGLLLSALKEVGAENRY